MLESAFNYGVTKTLLRKNAAAITSKGDWQAWLGLPKWTPEQAVCLLYGINPFNYCNVESNEQLQLLKLHAEFKGTMSPYQWRQFGIENNLPLPASIRDIEKPLAAIGAIQIDSNDADFSGLLNIPKRTDAWFQVIDDMTRDFYNQNKTIPNETQAWARLWTTPPDDYVISTSKDKGKEDCLTMPGASPLSLSAFSKRWKKYMPINPNNADNGF